MYIKEDDFFKISEEFPKFAAFLQQRALLRRNNFRVNEIIERNRWLKGAFLKIKGSGHANII